jgi:hypothetical protein
MVILASVIGVVVSCILLGVRYTANVEAWPAPTPDVLPWAAVVVLCGCLFAMVYSIGQDYF